jgi:hypothetical protein
LSNFVGGDVSVLDITELDPQPGTQTERRAPVSFDGIRA